ncbi:hypothetical protein HY251_18350 [bacterium]|nr:hypothetical protein [bacterium]
MVEAFRRATSMTPRSANDKEYFAQDWFAARVAEAGIAVTQQGRNSYPDFWLTLAATQEGYEVKSLAFTRGRPARPDIDFNSTIPSGRKQGCDVFLVFFLYTGSGSNPRVVHSISVAHADLINCDHALADEHLNVAVRSFGSYADGFIRNRKMYVFPHPMTIDPTGFGRCRLIVPKDWNVRDPRLAHISTLPRAIAPSTVESYTIRLRGRGQAEVQSAPSPDAGRTLEFDVFEAV